MIFKTLEYISLNLNDYFMSGPTPMDSARDGAPVVLENVAKIENPDANFGGSNKLILSLVNVEEESALKNQKAYRIRNNEVEYERPPVTLNLYVLFSANFDTYTNSLKVLSRLMEFFQSKNFFTFAEDPVDNDASLKLSQEERDCFKIHFDLYTLTFEQLNHLWGSLGGKQVPSAMYKVRVVRLKRNRLLEGGGVIERIQRTENVF